MPWLTPCLFQLRRQRRPAQAERCLPSAPGPLASLRPGLPGKHPGRGAQGTSLAADLCLCLCRLDECASLLQKHVVPLLRLRDVQALHQTCRALRPKPDSAQPELQAAALVRTQQPLSHLCHQLSLKHRCLQACTPRQHLASQAPPGSRLQQQLNSLSALHARIRHGQPATLHELHVAQADLPEGAALDAINSSRSPDGTCAAVAWHLDCRGRWQDLRMEALMLGVDAGGGVWRSTLPSVPRDGRQTCCTGFSLCGRYAAVVTDHTLFDGLGPSIGATCFDFVERRWLPQLPLLGRGDVGCSQVSFTEVSGEPLAAIDVDGEDYRSERVLMVFGPFSRRVCTYAIQGANKWEWVPGASAVILTRSSSLARLDLDNAGSAAASSLVWVPLPETTAERRLASAALTVQGEGIWVAQAVGGQSFRNSWICLLVFDVQGLVCHGSWPRVPADSDVTAVSPHVSQRAIAVSFLRCDSVINVVCVFQLEGPFTLGAQIFRNESLQWPRLSADSCFVLGVGSTEKLVIWDLRTGACLVSLQLPEFVNARWSSLDPSRVLVQCSKRGFRTSVLQF